MPATIPPEVSAPPLTLGRLVVLVDDYDAALAFYRAAFGATVLFDAPGPVGDRYVHLGFDGTATGTPRRGDPGIGLWLLRASGAARERIGQQTGGEPLAVFYTADVAAAVARAAEAGARIARSVEMADGARFAHVADLYGNVFVLVELASAAP
jgi:predicted enzyme related to lactoylglutathione lyase